MVRGLKVDPDEPMVSYDVTSLRQRKPEIHDNTINNRTNQGQNNICKLVDLCLDTIYFQYNMGFYRQKYDCATGKPVSPTAANLYLEGVESRTLNSFRGTAQSHWFSYVDVTWVMGSASLHRTKWTVTSNSHKRMSGTTAWPFWTVPYTLKRTGASPLEDKGNTYRAILAP